MTMVLALSTIRSAMPPISMLGGRPKLIVLERGTETWDEPDVEDPIGEPTGVTWLIWDIDSWDWYDMLYWYSVPATPPPVH